MEHWNLKSVDVEPQSPTILHSVRGEVRSIVVALREGDQLGDHEVHERTHLLVIDGDVEVTSASDVIEGGPGLMAVVEPGERRTIRARSDARLLLVLAPWPGEGHPGARDD